MTEFLRWLLAIEIIGLAFLPVTVWLLRRLPDRGYIFAKVLGIVLMTYVSWLVGMVLPIAGTPVLPILVLLGVGAGGWWSWRGETIEALRGAARLLLVEEALFVAALAVWCLLRVFIFDASIAHTEQFMDMAFLNSSIKSGSYPPYDPWMSGHIINYYYLGYLMFGLVIKVSGVPAAVGYNLALCTVFALTVAGSYSLGYALTQRVRWAALSPVFVALLGNWHAILWQIPHASCTGSNAPGFWGWLWDSSRIVGGHFALADWACARAVGPRDYTTINEFPLFSFVLGDLHPHVMAIPVVLLVLATGFDFLFNREAWGMRLGPASLGRLLVCAVCTGALFVINSWDFPTYLVVVVACLGAHAYLTDSDPGWWKPPVFAAGALAAASLVLYLPFYLRFRSLAHGIGLVSTPSDLFEYLQVFGFFLLVCGALVSALAFLLRPAEEEEDVMVDEEISRPAYGELGGVAAARIGPDLMLLGGVLGAVLVIGGVLRSWVLLLVLGLGVWTLSILRRVLNTEESNRSDAAALILLAAACGVLALTETIYVRDAFDGGALYRMNTVFKFYYQAWILLGLAGSYGAYRSWDVLRRYFRPVYAWAAIGIMALGALGAGVYTRYIPSYAVASYGVSSLDGMAWIQKEHPSDYAAIKWMSNHAPGGSVEVEAVGDDYQYGARVSTFTGLPTIMGWVGHEDQWRPGDSEIAQRTQDVRTIYTSADQTVTERLLRQYDVRYVVVGDQEHASYPHSPRGLAKFARFLRVAFHSGSTTVYQW